MEIMKDADSARLTDWPMMLLNVSNVLTTCILQTTENAILMNVMVPTWLISIQTPPMITNPLASFSRQPSAMMETASTTMAPSMLAASNASPMRIQRTGSSVSTAPLKRMETFHHALSAKRDGPWEMTGKDAIEYLLLTALFLVIATYGVRDAMTQCLGMMKKSHVPLVWLINATSVNRLQILITIFTDLLMSQRNMHIFQTVLNVKKDTFSQTMNGTQLINLSSKSVSGQLP